MDIVYIICIIGGIIGVLMILYGKLFAKPKLEKKIDQKEQWQRTHYICPYCESEIEYNGYLPAKIKCLNCDNRIFVYEGKIPLTEKSLDGKHDVVVKYGMGLKTKEIKSGDTYHQKIEDKHIDIRDSVIQRSNIGETSQKKISICPYCGEELGFHKPPKFCPYCREQISM